MGGEYEFIVVGAGIAGRALATQLARAGRTVLALEPVEEAEPERLASTGDSPEGMLLCPSNHVWEGLRALTGNDEWSAEQARARFQRVELIENRPLARALHRWCCVNPARRGFEGWLPTRALGSGLGKTGDRYFGPGDPNDWSQVDALREAMWCRPPAHDVDVAEFVRLRLLDTARAPGSTLTLRQGVRITRLLSDEPVEPGDELRITGVQYLEPAEGGGASLLRRALARREVILCGGVFEVPKLLLFSGIGPAAVLERHGIPLLLELPGVGAGYAACAEIAVETDAPGNFEYFRHGGADGTMVVTLHSSRGEHPAPDVLLYRRMLGGRDPEEWTWRWTIRALPSTQPGRNWRRVPEGEGAARAVHRPVDEIEAEALLDAVKFLRRTLRKAGIGEDQARIVAPTEVADLSEDEATLASFIRRQARRAAPVGTCALGRDGDPMAVLDRRMRVIGTANLRVVDEASFPTSPGFFLDVPLLVAAELAADDLQRAVAEEGDGKAEPFAVPPGETQPGRRPESQGNGAAAAMVAGLAALWRRLLPGKRPRAVSVS